MKTWLEIGDDGISVFMYRQKPNGIVQIAHNPVFEWFQTAEGAYNAPSFKLDRGEKNEPAS